MAVAYLGLGSNLGDRRATIMQALTLMGDRGVTVIKTSHWIETRPVGGPPDQGLFLNGAVKVKTDLTPLDLLDTLQTIERSLGRTRFVKNGPRTIDIDILLYDKIKIDSPRLTIPHPRMTERAFVMIPLKEIEPAITEELAHAHH